MPALAFGLGGRSRIEAAQNCGMDRQTLRDRVHRDSEAGLVGLVDRSLPGRAPMLSAEQTGELAELVEAGPDPEADRVIRWRRIDLCHVVERRFGIRVAERAMGSILRRLGVAKLSARPRPSPERSGSPRAIQGISPNRPARRCLRRRRTSPSRRGSGSSPGAAIGPRPLADARVGQQGTLTRSNMYVRRARRGTRPSAPKDCRYAWADIFGAVCPARATGAALVMPCANTDAMSAHLAEIGRRVSSGADAILVLDGAGWHSSRDLAVPANVTLLALPPY